MNFDEKLFVKRLKAIRRKLTTDEYFRDFITAGAVTAYRMGYDPVLISLAMAVVMQDLDEYIKDVKCDSDCSCKKEEEKSSHADDMKLRLMHTRAAAELRRTSSSGGFTDGKDVFVLEIVNGAVVGTGGHKLPRSMISDLEQKGIQVPAEFR